MALVFIYMNIYIEEMKNVAIELPLLTVLSTLVLNQNCSRQLFVES